MLFREELFEHFDVFGFGVRVIVVVIQPLVEEATFFWVVFEKLVDWHADLLFDFGQTGINEGSSNERVTCSGGIWKVLGVELVEAFGKDFFDHVGD